MTIGLEHIYRIGDEAKELRKRLHRTLELNEKITANHLISVLDVVCELHELTAKKLDEIIERLVRLEDEVRRKPRPEMRAAIVKKPKKRKAKRR